MADIVNKSDVFISYSRKNTDFARKLDTAFKELDMEVWADWEDIPKGANWRDEIRAGVEGADAFLFIISPDSVASKECRNEIELAVANNKRIVPVLHVELETDEDKENLHKAISAHNWIFAKQDTLEDEVVWNETFKQIVDTIRTDLNYVRQHTQLNLSAKRWQDRERDKNLLLRGDGITEAENWLTESGGKEPKPTELQTEYIMKSRLEDRLQQGQKFTMSLIGLVVAIILAVISFTQWQEAQRLRGIAEANEQKAIELKDVAERGWEETRSLYLSSEAQRAFDNGDPLLGITLAYEASGMTDPLTSVHHSLADLAYRPRYSTDL